MNIAYVIWETTTQMSRFTKERATEKICDTLENLTHWAREYRIQGLESYDIARSPKYSDRYGNDVIYIYLKEEYRNL